MGKKVARVVGGESTSTSINRDGKWGYGDMNVQMSEMSQPNKQCRHVEEEVDEQIIEPVVVIALLHCRTPWKSSYGIAGVSEIPRQLTSAIQALNNLVRQYNLDVVGLIETKLTVAEFNNVKLKTGFEYGLEVDCIDQRGGLGLLWIQEMELDIIKFCSSFIDTKLKDPRENM